MKQAISSDMIDVANYAYTSSVTAPATSYSGSLLATATSSPVGGFVIR